MKLRSHLIVIVVIAMIPVVLLSGITATYFARWQRSERERAVKDLAYLLGVAIERQITGAITTLNVLGLTSALDHGDLPTFREEAQRALITQDAWRTIFLADAAGRQRLNLARPVGAPLPDVGGRRYFREVLRTDRPAVGDLVVGLVTGVPSIHVAVPVMQGSRVRYVLAAALDAHALDRLMTAHRLPDSWTATLLDAHGRTVAGTRHVDRSRGQPAPADLVARAGEAWIPGTTTEGLAVYRASRRLPRSGLTVVVDIPRKQIDGPVRRWVALTLGVGTLAAALGAGLALVLGQRLSRPLRALQAEARTLGEGAASLPALEQPVAELEAIRCELAATASRLQAKTTEQEQAGERLRTSEARYRRIFENTPLIGSVWRPDGTMLDMNRRLEEVLGWTREDLVGRRWVEVTVPEADHRDPAQIVEEILRWPAGLGHVSRSATKDGRVLVFEWYNSPLHDADGTLVGMVSLGLDITDREQMTASLRASEARFRSITESALDAIISADAEGRILTWNRGACLMFGHEAPDVVGRSLTLLMPEGEGEARLRAFERAPSNDLLQGVNQVVETAGRRRDGTEFPLELSVSTWEAEGQRFYGAVLRDITRRRQAEDLLRQVIDLVPHPIYAEDGQGRLIFANQRYAELTGVPLGELVGRHLREIAPVAAEASAFLEEDREVLATRRPKVIEHTRTDRAGVPHALHTTKVPFRPVGQTETAVLGVSIEITELKRAERALRESEERLRLATTASGLGLWDINLRTGEVVVNAQYARMLGHDPGSFTETTERWTNGLHPEDRGRVTAHLRAYLAGEIPTYEVEYRQRTRAGGWTWILSLGQIVERETDDGPRRMLGINLDITERREAEERLRLLSRAVEQSPVSIVITDPAGHVVYVNPQFTRVTGYAAEEAIGQTPQAVKSGEHPEQFYRDLWETLRAGQEWRGTLHNRRKDGARLIEAAFISPVTDGRGQITHFLGVLEDITGRVELEAQLRQAQKMEAIGILAGGVAHDFNNLLTVINGYAQLALDERPATSVGRKIEQVRAAGGRAASLTRQLLAFSRQLPAQPCVVDLNVVVREMQKMLRRLIGEDVMLQVELADDLGQVRVDPGHVEQVVMNLAVNARDAMLHGGVLTIRTENADLDETYAISHIGVTPGRHVRLWVEDTGVGMDAETMSRIFEPFFTTKAPGVGTGLGLATVYGIVQQAGGCIAVESEPGRGARFSVCLPRIDEPVQVSGAPAPTLPIPRGEETILLVEDDDDVRALMGDVLRTCGYAVLEARHPGEGLLTVERHPSAIHLLVTDVVMPQMSGWELAERACQLRPDLRVLYVSGYPGGQASRRGLGPDIRLLPKPLAPSALAMAVREVLDGPTPRTA